MELVRGLPLNEYVAQHALALPARLALFVKICEAVQHAHHNRVIHRDFKPANAQHQRRRGAPSAASR
jgi:serine/threonine protein kinase